MVAKTESCSSPLLVSNSVFSSFSNGQLELIAIRNMSYTSLKDLTPSSPTGSQTYGEIPIKNRLVKQAAWAYLQPMSPASMESRDRSFFRRLGLSFSGRCVAVRGGGCFLFMNRGVFPAIGRAFERVFRALTRQKIGNVSAVEGTVKDSF